MIGIKDSRMIGFITRAELATRLGVSPQEIQRRERLGQIRPAKRIGKTPVYREQLLGDLMPYVGTTKRFGVDRERDYRKLYSYDPPVAQEVYKLLQEGKPLDQIVIHTGHHPGVVRAITDEYCEMTGAVLVLGTDMAKINALTTLDGNFPLQESGDLRDILVACAEITCTNCHKRPRAVCVACVSTVADEQET